MILDTNALSAAADDDPGVSAVLARAELMAIPVIVLGEYRHGIAQSRNRASYESWLTGLLNDCMVLDVTEPTTPSPRPTPTATASSPTRRPG